jgi:hypothetical protein
LLYRKATIETCATIVSPVDLALKHRLRMFEHRVLRRTFGCKEKEVTGDWKKLCNE